MATHLCRLDELDATGAKGVTLELGENRLRELVVVRDGGTVRAYENSCPHLSITLEARPDSFLDDDGRHLVCTMHGARFAVADGTCVSGPCEGARLAAVAIRIEADAVLLADVGT